MTNDSSPEQLHPLDRPSYSSLTGPHRRFAIGTDRAVRYPADVSPMTGMSDPADPQVWADLGDLAGPGRTVLLPGPANTVDHLPAGWEIVMNLPGVQLVATDALVTAPDPELLTLGPGDVDDMLDLVARTQPGPFERRTIELGTYRGVRVDGKLVAMGGERFRPPGFTEISAVCTDPAQRGRGLAGRVIRAVAHGIRERGEVPMLHTAATNTTAVRLYEHLGFAIRWYPTFFVLRAPAA
ncbi:GNAT family N-acetyltransferase [Kineosporia mesophila]|uniref:GNAT family N-acetyltransferase n=1 Tax=Kineosporia mesophila TaxID=566012 RepID=A0ABP7ANH9_9ACTN|nr:GNAT family N-acetyltransferase [Kineosporia mesophila]MCD5349341.1 GNAT family N-acetyltransferase [Kineosporia mesophila]